MNPSYGINFDNYKQLGIKKLKERAKLIRENKDFTNKVSLILYFVAMLPNFSCAQYCAQLAANFPASLLESEYPIIIS